MTPDAGGQPGIPVPLERERERVIGLLSTHFAYDSISLEDLERRMELVYRASTVEQLRELTRDLPSDPADAQERRAVAVPEAFSPEQDRLVSIMAETKRRGVWRPPRYLDVWSIMSETRLDLREALLASGVTEIHVRGVMSAVKVTVPPGVRVVVQTQAFMSSVHDEPYEPPRVGSGAPVVRITGFMVMGEVKVRVRARDPESGDEDL